MNPLRQPKKVYAGLVVAAIALFLLSDIGKDETNRHTVDYWVGSVGWFGFLACLLAIVVLSVALLVGRVRRRDTA